MTESKDDDSELVNAAEKLKGDLMEGFGQGMGALVPDPLTEPFHPDWRKPFDDEALERDFRKACEARGIDLGVRYMMPREAQRAIVEYDRSFNREAPPDDGLGDGAQDVIEGIHTVATVVICGKCRKPTNNSDAKCLAAALSGAILKMKCGQCGVMVLSKPSPKMPKVRPGNTPNRKQRRARSATRKTKGGIIVPR